MMKDYLLQFSIADWLLLLLLLTGAVVAYGYYYRTLPPLSTIRRYIAVALRFLVLALVLILFAEPVLQLRRQQVEKPVVAVLLDNSASMKIKDNSHVRGDSVKYLLREIRRTIQPDSLTLQFFKFDLQTSRLGEDSLDFSVDGTDLNQSLNTVLDSLSGKNLQGVVLVSDGVYNRGANPELTAQKYPYPIYTVTVGDPKPPKDIAIRRLLVNRITYVGKTFPVTIVIRSEGYENQQAVLTLRNKGQAIARKNIVLGKTGFEQKETLEIAFNEPGEMRLTAEISPIADESNIENNRQTATVQVLKSKLKVLVLSGLPNFDRMALSVAAGSLDEIDMTFLTEVAPGKYAENTFERVKPDSFDVVVFHAFPTTKTSSVHLKTILQAVRNNKLPVLWILSRTANYQSLREFVSWLPFSVPGGLEELKNIEVRLTGSGRLHPALKLNDNEKLNDRLWQSLPPVLVFSPQKPKDNAQILIEANLNENNVLPVLYTYREGGHKQMVLNMADFRNWHYMLQEDPLREQFFVRLTERVVRWLANREDLQQIQIQPQRRAFNLGEPIVFSGQVFDAFYQPISDAQVTVSISNDSLQVSDEIQSNGSGFYEQQFSGLPQGVYQYSVTAERNGKKIGRRNGSFEIRPYYLEFQQVTADTALLRKIADGSGGKNFTVKQFLTSFNQEQFNRRVIINHSEYYLWQYWYWLAAIIFLLAVEWFLRKRWGML
jgi:hypothetical protein